MEQCKIKVRGYCYFIFPIDKDISSKEKEVILLTNIGNVVICDK